MRYVSVLYYTAVNIDSLSINYFQVNRQSGTHGNRETNSVSQKNFLEEQI